MMNWQFGYVDTGKIRRLFDAFRPAITHLNDSGCARGAVPYATPVGVTNVDVGDIAQEKVHGAMSSIKSDTAKR